jgi:photosystem II stability/assembly factor-like uncharacterized protein
MFYNSPVRILIVLAFVASYSAARWQVQSAGIDTNLRGVSVARSASGKNGFVVWASGSNGVILRSANQGVEWQRLSVPDGANLDFRDIEAFDSNTAFVMSSGSGEKSRIYKTTDGGKNWTLQYSDKRSQFFLDSLACYSKTHCFALSDPVAGKFVILSTIDGKNWKELPHHGMPAILPDEGAFAASGTSLALCDHGKNIYFGTGGATSARVFHSANGGASWTAAETPIASGNASSGIFSLACNGSLVVAVGGDYKQPNAAKKVAATSNDFGVTWHLADPQPSGYRSAVAQFNLKDFVAVGPNGTDISHPPPGRGTRWAGIGDQSLNAISFLGAEGWGVGPHGAISHFIDTPDQTK